MPNRSRTKHVNNPITEQGDEPMVFEEYDMEAPPDDENGPLSSARWREDFSPQSGVGLRREATMFEHMRNAQVAGGESIWGLFSDEGDWSFAQWILKSRTTATSTNELLNLKKVSRWGCSCRQLNNSPTRHRSETATVRHFITADLSFRRSTPFHKPQSGCASSSM